MIAWLRRILRMTKKPTQSTPPAAPPTATLLPGVQHRKHVAVDGVDIPPLEQYAERVEIDHRLLEVERASFIALADGEVVPDLVGTARCEECFALAANQVAEGQLDAPTAYRLALFKVANLQRSALSGIALCPRHAKPVIIDGKQVLVSTAEAAQIEADRQLRAPVELVANLFVRREP